MSQVEIDDKDPSIIWTGDWTRTGLPDEHDNTVSGTRNGGSTAVVTFTGIGIKVLGTIPQGSSNGSSISKYVIDNGTKTSTFAPSPTPSRTTQQTFYTSDKLAFGTHQLHILDTIPSDGLWLDFFIVDTGLQVSTIASFPLAGPQPTAPAVTVPGSVQSTSQSTLSGTKGSSTQNGSPSTSQSDTFSGTSTIGSSTQSGFQSAPPTFSGTQSSSSTQPSSAQTLPPGGSPDLQGHKSSTAVIAASLSVGLLALVIGILLSIYAIRKVRNHNRAQLQAAEPFLPVTQDFWGAETIGTAFAPAHAPAQGIDYEAARSHVAVLPSSTRSTLPTGTRSSRHIGSDSGTKPPLYTETDSSAGG